MSRAKVLGSTRGSPSTWPCGAADFAVQVTGWVEQWFRTRHNPMEAPLQPYHDFLGLIREVKVLLEDLGMYEPTDQLRLADTTRNVLLAAHGQLQLPRRVAPRQKHSPRKGGCGPSVSDLLSVGIQCAMPMLEMSVAMGI